MNSQTIYKASNKKKTIVVIATGNTDIKFLDYVAMNDCYRFLQSKDSLKCLKLLQEVLNVDNAKFENRNMRFLLPRT